MSEITNGVVTKKTFPLDAVGYSPDRIELDFPDDGLVGYPINYIAISKFQHTDGTWQLTGNSSVGFAWKALPGDIYRRGMAVFVADDDYATTLHAHWEVTFYLDPVK